MAPLRLSRPPPGCGPGRGVAPVEIIPVFVAGKNSHSLQFRGLYQLGPDRLEEVIHIHGLRETRADSGNHVHRTWRSVNRAY